MDPVKRFLDHLAHSPLSPVVSEVHGRSLLSTSGRQMQHLVRRARSTLRVHGAPGDRAVLLADNSARWVAADLALLAEGRVVVPMYARQDPAELVQMMHDCDPSVVLVGSEALAEAVRTHWPQAPLLSFDELFAGEILDAPPHAWQPDDDLTIIYTSGTSGQAKGVVLTVANTAFMLPRTESALRAMMALRGEPAGGDRVFHYLPFCFAGSRIVLWTCLWRGVPIMVGTDLDNMAEELRTASPHYVLNVPMLLERIKNGVEANLRTQPAPIRWLMGRATGAWHAQPRGRRDRAALALADRLVFQRIRDRFGPHLRCLIAGSAPLGPDTQRWFEMVGIPVYQVYGLTETTAIVTMDQPPHVRAGRVGRALPEVQVRLGSDDELLVKGDNVFDRYWQRPEATAAAFDDGWFRTGDRAEVHEDGTWRIVGRVKNVLVPTSGHNVAPEPLERRLVETIEGVEHAVVVGHGRPHLAALVSGDRVDGGAVEQGIADLNAELPHYRRIRAHVLLDEPFTIDNGLLTANRKLKRAAIEDRFAHHIDAMYA
ncbi:MAG: AMP-binding protein [Myxococcales bacterium]|nr:AMP-binding protein [Myxococcales bacterium]